MRFKITVFIFVCIPLFLTTSACKKKESSAINKDKIDLNLVFNNQVDSNALVLNKLIYTNASGNLYQVNLLKYYISNIKLYKTNGDCIFSSNYELINENDESSKSVILKNIPIAYYNKIEFYLGIDPLHNHSGVQDGDLDPANDMIWDWNTGYVFFKQEGIFIANTGNSKYMIFHLATDAALSKSSITFDSLLFDNPAKKLKIAFNLNKAFNSQTKIDFNKDNWHTSTEAADSAWIVTMKMNLTNTFFIKSYQ